MNGAPTPPQPPYAPPQQPKKSGLHPLAWVAIGCGGLVVVGVVLFAALGWFAVKKGREFAAKVEDNPTKTAAELIVKLNPELELVSSDDAAGTMTIRNTKTGEIATFDYSEVQQGKLSFETESGKGSYSVDAGSGGLTVRSDEGVARLGGGGGDLPDWFPIYPGMSEPTSVFSNETATSRSGMAGASTEDASAEVLEWYEKAFRDAGFEVTVTRMGSGDESLGAVGATQAEPRRTANVTVTKDGAKTQLGFQYDGEID